MIPRLAKVSPDTGQPEHRSRHRPDRRGIAHDDQCDHEQNGADPSGGQVRATPSEGGQCPGHRYGGRDRAELAEHAGELRDQRDPPRREPARHQSQDTHEGHGVADPEEEPRRQRPRVVVREREADLGKRENQRSAEEYPTRTEPVDDEPDRHLHQRVHQQLEHDESRQLRSADLETLGSQQAGNGQ